MGTQGMYKGKHGPMGIGCMYTESMYGDKMHACKWPILWRLDAFQRMQYYMETQCV